MAIQIVREVTADVVKRGATRAVYAKQNDYNSRFLNIRIQEDGKDIVIDSEADVLLNVERPDKQEDIFKGAVNEDGTVRVPLTSWMLELEGTLSCDVSVAQEGVAKLTTMQFNIYVEAAVVTDEAVVETEEYSIIVDLLARTSRAAEMAEEAAANATTLKENCEEATEAAREAANGTMPTIKEHNEGIPMSFWIGTREEYEALEKKTVNRLYIITNDNERDGLVAQVNAINANIESFGKVLYTSNAYAVEGNNIEFDIGEYSLFAVTLRASVGSCVVFCGISNNTAGHADRLNGGNVVLNSSKTPLYFSVSVKLGDASTHEIEVARYSLNADYSGTGQVIISKIVGIM